MATPYLETELLLAVMEDRTEDSARIAGSMLHSEQLAMLDNLHRTISVLKRTAPATTPI